MATGFVVGQPRKLVYQPGAYTTVDASNLAFTPQFSYNVVAVLGAGLGGEPMVPYQFSDPLEAQQLFGAGTPISDAIRFAFAGGANGGASQVIGVRIDNCGQASGTLNDANSGTAIAGTFKDFGAYGNTYTVSFYPGSTAGTLAVVQGKTLDGRDYLQRIDNETSFSRLIQRINDESPVSIELTTGGARASQTLTLATSQVDGRATLTDGQGQQRSTQAYCYQYPKTTSENDTDSMVVTFDGALSWAISAIDVGTETFTTVDPHGLVPGNYVRMSGTTLPPELSAAATYVVYETPTLTTFRLTAVNATPLSWAIASYNDTTDLFTAPGVTFPNNSVVQLSGVLASGLAVNRNYFVVNRNGDEFQLATTIGGVPINATGSISNAMVTWIGGSTLGVSGTISGGSVTLLPGYATVSNSTPSGFNGARTAAKARGAYSQGITGAVVNAVAYASDAARITLASGEKWGHLQGLGLPGTVFEIVSGVYAGTYQILHFEWDGLGADVVRVVRKLTGDRRITEGTLSTSLEWWAFTQFPRLQPASTALETQLPGNGVLPTGGQYITLVVGGETAYYATQPGDSVIDIADQLVNLVNSTEGMLVTASAAYNPATYTATITLVADIPGTVPNTYEVRALLNVQTALLLTASGATLSGGVDPQPPRSSSGITSGTLFLNNGFDSVPTYQRWLEGLDAIQYIAVRWIVPAGTANLGVQTAIADHCTLLSAADKRRERMAVFGHELGWSDDQIKSRAETFQSERVVFVTPGVQTSDAVTGLPRMYPSYYAAAMVAGMLAAEGNGINDPITYTFLRNVTKLEKDYQDGSLRVDGLIQSGALVMARDASLTRASRGFKVVRAVTTFRTTVLSALKSNAYESISIVNQSDFIAASIRETEEKFIGTPILPETLEQVRTAVNLELNQRSRERVIYGYEPGYTQVSLNADAPNALDVIYKFYPAPALEFIGNTQILLPLTAIAEAA